MAQGLLYQAQVFGGPEQSVAMQSRLKGGRDRPCLSIMNEKGRPFGLPTEKNRKPSLKPWHLPRAAFATKGAVSPGGPKESRGASCSPGS